MSLTSLASEAALILASYGLLTQISKARSKA
jgi:hypothetical protein